MYHGERPPKVRTTGHGVIIDRVTDMLLDVHSRTLGRSRSETFTELMRRGAAADDRVHTSGKVIIRSGIRDLDREVLDLIQSHRLVISQPIGEGVTSPERERTVDTIRRLAMAGARSVLDELRKSGKQEWTSLPEDGSKE